MSKNIVVIPSFNELSSLKKIVKHKSSKYKFIVIDDGSTDGTKQFLIKNKINFISNNNNLGYEKSLIKAFTYLKKNSSNIKNIITFDADGEHKIKDINKLLILQDKKNFDLIICNRSNLIRNIEKLLSYLFFKKYKIKDPLTGFKLYDFKKLKKIIHLIHIDYFLVDIIKIFMIRNFKITNYKIKLNKIKSRNPRVGGSINVNLKIFNIFRLLFN